MSNWYDSFQCATWLFSTFYWQSTMPRQTASPPCHNQRRFFVTTVCRLLPPTLTITSTNTRQLLLSTTGFTLTELNFLQQFYSPLRAFFCIEQQLTSFSYGSHLVDCFCAECHLSHGYFHLLYLSLLLNRPSLLHIYLALFAVVILEIFFNKAQPNSDVQRYSTVKHDKHQKPTCDGDWLEAEIWAMRIEIGPQG